LLALDAVPDMSGCGWRLDRGWWTPCSGHPGERRGYTRL